MKTSRLIHILAIAAMLLLPLMFQRPNEAITLQNYLLKCLMPFLMVVTFYLNYLCFIPRWLVNQDKARYWTWNGMLLTVFCICLFFWRWYEFVHIYPPHGRLHGVHSPAAGPMGLFHIFSIVRDAFNLLLAILAAYSIRMTSHAALLNQKRQEAEVARRDAELKGLRQQISPHFLLNTLNNIYALTAISADRAQAAVMQLSNMLRHMLYDNQERMVSLKSESAFIQSYVDLMRLRLASNVKVTLDIDISDDDKTMVAPLLFISLVENAFKHGVSSMEPSSISISLASLCESPEVVGPHEGNIIKCCIVNTNYPKNNKDRSGHGIGLQQVQQRLDVVYKDHYKWTRGISEADSLYHSEIILW